MTSACPFPSFFLAKSLLTAEKTIKSLFIRQKTKKVGNAKGAIGPGFRIEL